MGNCSSSPYDDDSEHFRNEIKLKNTKYKDGKENLNLTDKTSDKENQKKNAFMYIKEFPTKLEHKIVSYYKNPNLINDNSKNISQNNHNFSAQNLYKSKINLNIEKTQLKIINNYSSTTNNTIKSNFNGINQKDLDFLNVKKENVFKKDNLSSDIDENIKTNKIINEKVKIFKDSIYDDILLENNKNMKEIISSKIYNIPNDLKGFSKNQTSRNKEDITKIESIFSFY